MDKKFKKVAVCLSGNPRTFEKTHSDLKTRFLDNIAESYDFFIHMPNQLNWRGDESDRPLSKNEIDNILKHYDPKKIILDDQGLGSDGRFRNEMLARVKGANSLRKEYEQENNVSYDMVIRARPDLKITCNFNDMSQIDENKIGIASFGRAHKGWTDTFAMGPGHLMDVYCALSDEVGDYNSSLYKNTDLRPRSHRGRTGQFAIELVLMHYLQEKNIPVYLMSDLQYCVLRIDGGILWLHDQYGAEMHFNRNGLKSHYNSSGHHSLIKCDPVPITDEEIFRLIRERYEH